MRYNARGQQRKMNQKIGLVQTPLLRISKCKGTYEDQDISVSNNAQKLAGYITETHQRWECQLRRTRINVDELLLESLIIPVRHKGMIIICEQADEHRKIQYIMQSMYCNLRLNTTTLPIVGHGLDRLTSRVEKPICPIIKQTRGIFSMCLYSNGIQKRKYPLASVIQPELSSIISRSNDVGRRRRGLELPHRTNESYHRSSLARFGTYSTKKPT